MPKKVHKNHRRKPTQARALAKYNAIVQASAQVLVEKGYRGATTEAIALEADVSIGTLYEYFKNKDDIFTIYLNQQVASVMAEIAMQVRTEESLSTTNLIERMVEKGVKFIFQHHSIFSTIVREIPSLWEVEQVKALDKSIVVVAKVLFKQSGIKASQAEFDQIVGFLLHTILGLYIRIALMGIQNFSPESLKRDVLDLISGYILLKTGTRLEWSTH